MKAFQSSISHENLAGFEINLGKVQPKASLCLHNMRLHFCDLILDLFFFLQLLSTLFFLQFLKHFLESLILLLQFSDYLVSLGLIDHWLKLYHLGLVGIP